MADGARITAPLVVAGWGAFNGLLDALQAGMGGRTIALTVYGGAVVLIEIVAAAVFISRRRRPGGGVRRDPPGGGTVLLIAIGAFLAGLGLAFSWWISVASAVIFVLAAVNAGYIAHRVRG